MCYACCLPMGCIPITRKIEKPEGYEDAPEKMFCPRCGDIGKPVFRKTSNYCCLFFIPCIPCGSGSTFLSCPNCDFSTGKITGETCSSCHVTTASESSYCPNCGKGRAGVPSNPEMKGDSNDSSEEMPKRKEKEPFGKPRGRKIGEFKN